MEPERWAAVESLYHAALEREPTERSMWLRQACGDDALLLGEVESLLACAGANLSNPDARPEMAKIWDHIAGDQDAGSQALNPGVAGAEAASAPGGVPTALPPTIGRQYLLGGRQIPAG